VVDLWRDVAELAAPRGRGPRPRPRGGHRLPCCRAIPPGSRP
jgi:hypothetical protein